MFGGNRPAHVAMRGLLLITAFVVLLITTLALTLGVTGFPVSAALAALWEGSFGSLYAFTSGTLVRATPLILTGLAVTLAFRAGIWNIGAEGQLLAGAGSAIALSLFAPSLQPAVAIPILIMVGGVAGAAWASVAAILKRAFGVLEVISTIMLNFLAAHLISYLVRGPLQEPLGIYPQSAELPAAYRLSALASDTRLTLALPISMGIAGLLWFLLKHTASGFRIRAVGANPVAAQVAGGIDVRAVTFCVFLLSGALAGIAGSLEILAVTSALYENLSPGYGYTAIAVALLGRLHPLAVILSAIAFGALEAGAASMQRSAGVPSVVVWVVEGILLLALIFSDRLRDRIATSPASPLVTVRS